MSVLPAAGKVATLRRYAAEHGLRAMVETGVYMGSCSGMQMLDALDLLVVIDYQRENIDLLPETEKLLACLGDSGAVLTIILADRVYRRWNDRPALFWLDAHAIDSAENAPPCPLRAELAAIMSWRHGADSVVLIDDLRLMQPDTVYVRELGWPTLEELRRLVDGFWRREERDDIMRLTPREKGSLMSTDDQNTDVVQQDWDEFVDSLQQEQDDQMQERPTKTTRGKGGNTKEKKTQEEKTQEEKTLPNLERDENPELYAEMQARGLRDPD